MIWAALQAAAALLLAAQDSSSSDDMHLAGVLHGPAASGGMGARLVAAAAEASPVKQMLVSTVSAQQGLRVHSTCADDAALAPALCAEPGGMLLRTTSSGVAC